MQHLPASGDAEDLMLLDVPTLIIVSIFVTSIWGSCSFCLGAGRSIQALAWCGRRFLVAGSSIALLSGRLPVLDAVSIDIAERASLRGLRAIVERRAIVRRQAGAAVLDVRGRPDLAARLPNPGFLSLGHGPNGGEFADRLQLHAGDRFELWSGRARSSSRVGRRCSCSSCMA